MIRLTFTVLSLISLAVANLNRRIVLTNDDGWAVANIRAHNDALKAAGFDVRREMLLLKPKAGDL